MWNSSLSCLTSFARLFPAKPYPNSVTRGTLPWPKSPRSKFDRLRLISFFFELSQFINVIQSRRIYTGVACKRLCKPNFVNLVRVQRKANINLWPLLADLDIHAKIQAVINLMFNESIFSPKLLGFQFSFHRSINSFWIAYEKRQNAIINLTAKLWWVEL